ncbi:tripartite motif-containing protein 16 [Sarotherodon galilaeus]
MLTSHKASGRMPSQTREPKDKKTENNPTRAGGGGPGRRDRNQTKHKEHETKTEPRNKQKQSKTEDAGVQGNSVHGEQKVNPGGDSTKVHSSTVLGADHVRSGSGSRTGLEAGGVEDGSGYRAGPEAGPAEDGGGHRAGPEASSVEDGGGGYRAGPEAGRVEDGGYRAVETWWALDQTRPDQTVAWQPQATMEPDQTTA